MSFRELRNFCEILRSLGYPRLVSMENFRTPNFELVADILDWLLHRFEPGCSLPDDISTEAHRVKFIQMVCEKVVLRTGIRLNAKKLYGADGWAAKELLKLATVLHEAQKSVVDIPRDAFDDSFTLNAKLSDLKSARAICSQIIESGAGLFDLLQKEADVRQDRERALSFLDGLSRNLGSSSGHDAVERAVNSMLTNHSQSLQQLKQMTEELRQDEKNLEQKVKKRQQELERARKRLLSLTCVRPAFMDEYEKLEQELERYYEQYVGRFRNLDYLEYELDQLNREEQERMEENERALKKMQKRLRDEEWRLLRGEDDDPEAVRGRSVAKATKVQTARRRPDLPSGANVQGAMDAGDDEGSTGGSGSDSDPPISVGSQSQGSGRDGFRGAGSAGAGASDDDDDILDESDGDEDFSDTDKGLGPMRGTSKLHSNHDF